MGMTFEDRLWIETGFSMFDYLPQAKAIPFFAWPELVWAGQVNARSRIALDH